MNLTNRINILLSSPRLLAGIHHPVSVSEHLKLLDSR